MERQSRPYVNKIPGNRGYNRIGKKKQSVMDVELPKLHQAIATNGYSEELANHVIELIKPFVGYGLITWPP